MPTLDRATTIRSRCNSLQKNHSVRNKKIQEWYKIINLEENKEIPPRMENFTGNDPKTYFTMSRFLLTNPAIHNIIDTNRMNEKQSEAVGLLEDLADLGWADNFKQALQQGRGGFLYRFSGLLIAQGGYAVFAKAFSDRLIAQVWNPYQVFPDFDDWTNGPSEVCRIYEVPVAKARSIAYSNGWVIPNFNFQGNTKIYNYFGYTDEMVPYNTVLIGNDVVRWTEIGGSRLPVYYSTAGGIPDIDVVLGSTENFPGESIIATNIGIYKNLNRTMTHIQQITKDTAQPPIKEYSSNADKKIVDENKIFTRAYVMRMGTGEDVRVLDMPSLPPETTSHAININDMRQRGSVPDIAFGNLQQSGLNSLMMSQVTQAALSALQPYLDVTVSLFNEINDMWVKEVLDRGWSPYGWIKPTNLPPVDDIKFNTDFRVKIPGDLVSRATTMRMLAPDIEISPETTLSLLFPEIKDPARELAKAHSSKVMNHAIEETRQLLESYRVRAEQLKTENPRSSELYSKIAARLEQELTGETEQDPAPSPRRTSPRRNLPIPRQEVLPQEAGPVNGNVPQVPEEAGL